MPTTVYPSDMQWLKEDDNDYSYEVKREHNRDMVVEMVGTIKVKTTREIERIRCYFSPLDSFFFFVNLLRCRHAHNAPSLISKKSLYQTYQLTFPQ